MRRLRPAAPRPETPDLRASFRLASVAWNAGEMPERTVTARVRHPTSARVAGGNGAPGAMGVAVDGSESSWPGPAADPALPPFDRFNRQSRTIELFNRGRSPFHYEARADRPWINVSMRRGKIRMQERLHVTISPSSFSV